jgi:hypothetical protein
MDLYHLRHGLHMIAASWDYHGGAESRVSICGNSVHFSCSISVMFDVLFYLFHVSCMIIYNASSEEEQVQSFGEKESRLSLEKGK